MNITGESAMSSYKEVINDPNLSKPPNNLKIGHENNS